MEDNVFSTDFENSKDFKQMRNVVKRKQENTEKGLGDTLIYFILQIC